MQDNPNLIKFLENISKSEGPLSFSFSDFYPIESIIDYRTIEYHDELKQIEFSHLLVDKTCKIIININGDNNHTFEKTEKIINLIQSRFNQRSIDIQIGGQLDSQNKTTIDIILYE